MSSRRTSPGGTGGHVAASRSNAVVEWRPALSLRPEHPREHDSRFYARVDDEITFQTEATLDLVRIDDRVGSTTALRRTARAESRRWRAAIRAGHTEPRAEGSEAVGMPEFDARLVSGRIAEADVELWGEWHDASTWLYVVVDSENRAQVSPTSSEEARALDRIFSMASWPSIPADRLRETLDAVPQLQQLVVLDVGQGSANALLDANGQTILHFDAGTGVGQNAMTAPAHLSFCVCGGNPIVILSHWDQDHWAGARKDTSLLNATWIVPRQSIGATHSAFARSILQAGGRIWVVKRSSRPRVKSLSGQCLKLLHGTGRSRNDSGQTLVVEGAGTSCKWVLPGDARYDKIDQLSSYACALVASHHGARQPAKSVPPSRSECDYARLVYSVGHGNSYGHPSTVAQHSHSRSGWALADTRFTGASAQGRHSIAVGCQRRPQPSQHLAAVHNVVMVT